MNENKVNKWLDEIISKTINTRKPQFDAEKFKQKFPDELRLLQSRAFKQPQKLINWTIIFKNPISKLATAAVIILTVGLFVFFSEPKDKTTPPKVQNVEKSPVEMLTLRSLKIAYYNGGIEAVEAQCDNAIERLKPKSNQITVDQLFAEINGT
jgi:hypothetical protein